jgi:flagellar biosynthesis/type III secretory pathway M-ring protein FliF/YscJ
MSKLKSLLSPIGSWTPLIKTIAVVVVIALLVLGFSQIRGCSSEQKDEAFNERQEGRETQIETNSELERQKELERTALIARAEAAERQAKEEEAKRKEYESILNQLGSKAGQLKERADDEGHIYVAEQNTINADIDPIERCKRICTKLNIRPENCACEQ